MSRQCLSGVAKAGVSGNGSGGRELQQQEREHSQAAEGRRGTAYLCRTEPELPAQLRRTLSQWRADRIRLRGVGRESGREQTDDQAPTDAVDSPRRPFAVADPYTGPQRGVGGHVSALVSGFPAGCRSAGPASRRLTPESNALQEGPESDDGSMTGPL